MIPLSEKATKNGTLAYIIPNIFMDCVAISVFELMVQIFLMSIKIIFLHLNFLMIIFYLNINNIFEFMAQIKI